MTKFFGKYFPPESSTLEINFTLLDYSFTVTYFLEWLWKSVFLVCLIRDLYFIDVAYRTKL